jgi:hypothetical protein
MKEVQDDRWIGKVKDLLEEYTPADAPGDWKQVKRKLNRNQHWFAWLLMFLRRPWMFTIMFGAGILTGYFLFFHADTATVIPAANIMDISNGPIEKPLGKPGSRTTLPDAIQPVSKPDQTPVSESAAYTFIKASKNTQATEKDVTSLNITGGVLVPILTGIADTIHPDQVNRRIADVSPAIQAATGQPVTPAWSTPVTTHDTLPQPVASDAIQNNRPVKKPRKPFDLPALSLKGDPWKVGLGYEYLAMIQPDTGKGYFRGLMIKFDKQIAPKLWLGTGLFMGKTGRERIAKYLVKDVSKPDTASILYMRDSSVSYRKWQNHLAIPVSMTYDLVRNRNFALPVSGGATFGFAYHPGYSFSNDGYTVGNYGGSTNGFTGFITLDLSVGYEVFYLRGLSATLAAEYRCMIAGPKSYGFGENFIGGKIVLNLDFDRGKWKKKG